MNYLIPYGIADNKFTVDAKSGLVSTNTSLDREEQSSYVITGKNLVLKSQRSMHSAIPRYRCTSLETAVVSLNIVCHVTHAFNFVSRQ